jgi:hypothetical protein
LGKDFIPYVGDRIVMRHRNAAAAAFPPSRHWRGGSTLALYACALLAVSACASGSPDPSDRDGRYIGTLSTQSGICGLSVSPDGKFEGVLTVRGGEVLFAPEEGVVVLPGRIDAAGHVTAAESPIGADHKPFTMVFEGDLHGNKVTGRYATPRCRASAVLTRG